MPCYRPLDAWQCVDGAVVFSEGKGNKRYDISRSLKLACGQCVGCRLERSRQWAVRCTHEKQMHDENSYLTLTLDEENNTGTLDHEIFQGFLKRLRQHVVRNLPRCSMGKDSAENPAGLWAKTKSNRPESEIEIPTRWKNLARRKAKIAVNYIRYFMCGEYGEKTKRPHYHAIIFGWDPKDKTSWGKTRAGHQLYMSKQLNKIWGKGNVIIGAVTFESTAYVARYIMAKITGQAAANHYTKIDADTGEIIERKPEYTHMSLKPGIGARWLEKYATDAYPEGKVLARGHKSKTPKYYDKQWKKLQPLQYEDLLFEREKVGIQNAGDNTKERLATKEIVAKQNVTRLKRILD